MNLKQSLALQFGLFVLCAALSLAFRPHMPATVPTHWGASGQPDAWGSPTALLWMGPVLLLFSIGMTVAIPWLPKGKNVGRFAPTYGKVMLIVAALFTFLHVELLQTARYGADLPGSFMAGMFLFFAALGNLFGKIRPNPYVGIRVPWTMNNERVWELTHRRAGYIYVIGGITGALLVALGLPIRFAIPFMILFTMAPVFDSYLISKRVS